MFCKGAVKLFDILRINKFVREGKIDEIVLYINSLENKKTVINWLLYKLRKTNNAWVRHTIALSMAELKCEKAVDILIPLINRYCNTDNYSGLVFSLLELNCADKLIDIVHLMYDGNYMVRRYMADILILNWSRISSNDKAAIIDKLNNYVARSAKNIRDLQDRYDGIDYILDELT